MTGRLYFLPALQWSISRHYGNRILLPALSENDTPASSGRSVQNNRTLRTIRHRSACRKPHRPHAQYPKSAVETASIGFRRTGCNPLLLPKYITPHSSWATASFHFRHYSQEQNSCGQWVRKGQDSPGKKKKRYRQKLGTITDSSSVSRL